MVVEINRWLERRLRSRVPQGMGWKWGKQRRTKWGSLDSQAQHTFSVFSKCLRYVYLRKTKICILANLVHRQDVLCSMIIIVQNGSNSNVNWWIVI